MKNMGPSLFWGLLLIIIGFSLIFRIVFNIDFPLFRVIVAFLFIFIGFRILLGTTGFAGKKAKEENVIFSERHYKTVNSGKDYSVVFGSGVYDLRDYDPADGKRKIKISTVFGGAEVKINHDSPVRIRVDAVFAGVTLPNGNSAVLGNSMFESPSYDPDKPYLDLKLEAVFGGIEVKAY